MIAFFFRTGDSLDMFVINIYNYILLFLKEETASIAYIILIFIYNNTLFLKFKTRNYCYRTENRKRF